MLIGLVGKPNTGKSTFFKACTLADVLIANYPFATIKPNHGIGYVKIDCIDKEFNVQCNPRTGFCINHIRFVPVELMDVAGLVPGASEGKGLGNQFLDDLTAADAFIHIVDISGETNIEGKLLKEKDYDPSQDIEFLEKELDLWFLRILKKVWKDFTKKLESTKEEFAKSVAKQFSGLKITENQVRDVILKHNFNTTQPSKWTDKELLRFCHELRHFSKPMIIAANKSDTENAAENLKKIKSNFPNLIIIPCSADSELALKEASKHGLIEYIPGESNFKVLKQLSQAQKQALETIKEKVLDVYGSTGIQEVLNKTVFGLLDYIAVFPAGSKLADSKGNILPDCFLLPNGSTALDFAFIVHTDLGKNFIRAIDARTKRVIGKEHVLKHRDGIEIIT